MWYLAIADNAIIPSIIALTISALILCGLVPLKTDMTIIVIIRNGYLVDLTKNDVFEKRLKWGCGCKASLSQQFKHLLTI